MSLTDREKEQLKALIDAGQPLPPRYKPVLFAQPHEAELIWPGKTAEVTNVVLPFQSIEQIDEPRAETSGQVADLFAFDAATGRQSGGWTNKLIWGDNKLVLASLKNGPMRREIEAVGGLKLVYIDPPFDVGADFSFDIEVGGGERFTKEASVIEDIAYRDTWGRGADSYYSMIYERLQIIHGLMSSDASIYVHCDYRVNSGIRFILNEIFGHSLFLNQITWKRIYSHSDANRFGIVDDTLLFYARSNTYTFNKQFRPHSESYVKSHYGQADPDGRKYRLVTLSGAGPGPARAFGDRGTISPPTGRHWAWSQERINGG